jgi:hypothetical protein
MVIEGPIQIFIENTLFFTFLLVFVIGVLAILYLILESVCSDCCKKYKGAPALPAATGGKGEEWTFKVLGPLFKDNKIAEKGA